jgi:hypothetical protein
MTGDLDYTVRWFRDDDLDYYIHHLNNSLYNEYDEERFKWKFLANPFKLDIVPIAMVEETKTGKLVGFNSFLPLELNTGSAHFPIVQGCDGYIETTHRRKGLFQRTIHFMTDYFSGRDPELLLGFNFVESLGAARKAGSISTASINRWFFKPCQVKTRLTRVIDLDISRSSVKEIHEIYQENSSNQVLHIHRTLNYLKWRFDESPLRDYEMYEYRVGDLSGYIIFSTIKDEEGRMELSIDDYFPQFPDADVFFMVLNEILRWHQDVELVELYTMNNDVVDREVPKMGLEKDLEPRYTLIMKPINLELVDGEIFRDGVNLSDIGAWHLTKSDIY